MAGDEAGQELTLACRQALEDAFDMRGRFALRASPALADLLCGDRRGRAENLLPDRLPRTAEQQQERIELEARRALRVSELAGGLGIDLYTHNDWFGIPDNLVAVVEKARELGVPDIGISYNFSHARDEIHDDTVDFDALWSRIQPYVTSVNLAGTHFEDDTTLYPGDGEHDLEMMRVIEDSGWRGPVGVIAETGGDAEVSLRNAILRVEWLASELIQPGSGGAMPVV